MKLVIFILASFLAVSFAVPTTVPPSTTEKPTVESSIANEVVKTLQSSPDNFTHFKFYKARAGINDSYRDVEFDVQDPSLIWDIAGPVNVKANGRINVEVNFDVSMSYFYFNGTFVGIEPNSSTQHYGDFVSFLDGNLTISVKTIFNTRTRLIIFDTTAKPQNLKFVTHVIEWSSYCGPHNLAECEKTKSGTLDGYLPDKLVEEINKRVHDVLYSKKDEIKKRISV